MQGGTGSTDTSPHREFPREFCPAEHDTHSVSQLHNRHRWYYPYIDKTA